MAFQDFNVEEIFSDAQRMPHWYEKVMSRFEPVLFHGKYVMGCRVVVHPDQPLVRFGSSQGNVAAVQFLREHQRQQRLRMNEEQYRPIREKQQERHADVISGREMIEQQMQAYITAHGTSTIIEIARALKLQVSVARGVARAYQRRTHVRFDLRRGTGARTAAVKPKARSVYRGPRQTVVDIRAWSAMRRHRAA